MDPSYAIAHILVFLCVIRTLEKASISSVLRNIIHCWWQKTPYYTLSIRIPIEPWLLCSIVASTRAPGPSGTLSFLPFREACIITVQKQTIQSSCLCITFPDDSSLTHGDTVLAGSLVLKEPFPPQTCHSLVQRSSLADLIDEQ